MWIPWVWLGHTGQCILARLMAFYHCNSLKNKTLMSIWVHISWFLVLRKARKPTISFKTGYWPVPCFWETGDWPIPCFSETGDWPIPCFSETGYWPIPCFERFFLFFALLQCYWLDDGSEVLANSLLIPRWKKFEFPTRGFAARGEFIFFTSGFGGNSPIPPRHHQAIISVDIALLYKCFFL